MSNWNFGYRINSWEEDGLIGAFGARAIVDCGSHTGFKAKLDFLYDRQSVVGTDFGKKAIIHLVNKNKVISLLGEWMKNNSYEKEKVYSLWEEDEGESNPLRLEFRFSGGYCYIRLGLVAPYNGELERHECDNPKGKKWFRDSFLPLGSELKSYIKNGKRGKVTVCTYAYGTAGYLYGFGLNESEALTTCTKHYPYSNPWSILCGFAAIDIDLLNLDLVGVGVPLSEVTKVVEST